MSVVDLWPDGTTGAPVRDPRLKHVRLEYEASPFDPMVTMTEVTVTMPSGHEARGYSVEHLPGSWRDIVYLALVGFLLGEQRPLVSVRALARKLPGWVPMPRPLECGGPVRGAPRIAALPHTPNAP